MTRARYLPDTMKIHAALLGFTVMASGACGGAAPPPSKPTPAETASASPAASASAPAGGEPTGVRPTTAQKYLKTIDDAPPELQGRLAANGLSEEVFALPSDVRMTLDAISGGNIDPSQRSRIVAALLGDSPAKESIEKHCGQPAAQVLAALQKMKPEARTKSILATCKADKLVDPARVGQATWFGVALAMVVTDLLEASGKTSAAELELARRISLLDDR